MTEVSDKMRERNFESVSGEKEKNIKKMSNNLKISRRTLNRKKNNKK